MLVHLDYSSIRLSQKERDTLELLFQGLRKTEIAKALNLTVGGIRQRFEGLYIKFGIATSHQRQMTPRNPLILLCMTAHSHKEALRLRCKSCS